MRIAVLAASAVAAGFLATHAVAQVEDLPPACRTLSTAAVADAMGVSASRVIPLNGTAHRTIRPVPFARPFKGSESTCEWADLRHELASVFLTLVTLTSASEAKRYYNALLYPSHCPKPAQLKFGTVACGGPGGMTVVEGHFMVKLEGSTGDGTSMSVASLEELATKVFQVAPLVQPR